MLAQSGKQCKPVQVHDFCKSACWGNIPNPLRTSSCDDGCSLILSVSKRATSGQFGQKLFWKKFLGAICAEVKIFLWHSSAYLFFLQLSSRINAENWISVRDWFYSLAGLPDLKSDIFVKGWLLLHVGCYIEPSEKCRCSCACFLMLCVTAFLF